MGRPRDIGDSASVINTLDGATAGTVVNSKVVVYGSSGEVNATTLQISGTAISATAAEINLLDGVTATTAELNYVDGVTSNVQTQLDAKQAADANLTSFLSALDLPTSDGTNGQALITNGSGTLSFGDSGKVFGTPTNTTPAQGATDVAIRPTLTASAFINLDGLTMAAAQWQISTASDFSSTVVSSGDVAGTSTSYTVGASDALAAETLHYWRVRYKDSAGNYSSYSTATSFTTGVAAGQQLYSSGGTYSWTAPSGVNSVCVVVVGAGGSGMKDHDSCGGGGGALAYKNNITVTPGSSYTVVVGSPGASRTSNGQQGADGGDSYFINTSTCYAQGGRKGQSNSTANTSGRVGDGGGEGGGSTDNRGGACGAAGYSGNGGDSKYSNTQTDAAPSGGGGSASYNFDQQGSHGAGGVGVLGEGTSGAAAGSTVSTGNGRGGSGGADGGLAQSGSSYFVSGTKGNGGDYGGGGGRGTTVSSYQTNSGAGGKGAVRIIWGSGRSFPSTNTADV